ncbi:MAG: DPP IV N-terminal domain-containing protein [Longimicrobiales bacterium]|nr:DPP IV N-terminal domain-containing protein [Longimicrobiales bacterium]
MSPPPLRAPFLALALTLASAVPGSAQQPTPYRPQALTAEDYAQAERFLSANMGPLVLGGSVRPTWLEGDRFWYRNDMAEGAEFVLVDPARRTRARAFDHEGVARGLSAATGEAVRPFALPFTRFDFADGGIRVEVAEKTWICDPAAGRCAEEARATGAGRDEALSPDGTEAAFIRAHNLWVRDVATGAETRLTTDGIEDFGYATDNAGWTKSDRPVVLWSPDSRKIATFQHDARGVGEMGLVSTVAGAPRIEVWKYPLPEDTVIFRISRVVVHLDGPRVVRLRMPPDQHRSTICDHIYCNGTFSDVQWSDDGRQLAFVSSSRDHKEARLRVADPETGVVRDVMDERVETFFESGFDMVNWRVLFGTNEVLWWSQRDDWGHLYLHDLGTGALKRQITSGAWNVLQVRHLDEEARTLWFTGAGREKGDPYFDYLYSVSLDRGEPRILTPDSAHHTITMSPSGRFFVDSWSTPLEPPVTVLRDARGREVLKLETADVSRLVAAGWKAPIPFITKARDGVTDLYGLLYTPTDLDPSKKYPVVNYLYPGPQTGSIGSRSFSPSRRDHQALAELGFIVVEVDAMGTPKRSKSFHAAYYGNMGDNGLADQVTTIRQLAERNPWMDIDRVGIWGHSGGGFASTAGILRFPDFYKVAVSQAGNHDNRIYEDDWGEKWQGLLEKNPDGTMSHDNQANQLVARNLKGKLLLAHGTMDSNVPPNNTLAVVDSLIAANKDFDLIMLPNRRHGFGNEPYMQRRRWDYFVKNLLGAEPPKGYEIGRRPVS